MREIKAPRVWIKRMGVMVKPEDVVSIDYRNVDTDKSTITVRICESNYRFVFESVELMWPTGLEGNELFDGDIVISDEYPIRAEDGYVGVIEHDDGVFWLTRRKKKDSEVRGMSDGIADYLYEHKDANLVRIGNIYENPELLGGTGA